MSREVSVFETVFGMPYEADRQQCYRRLFELITSEQWTPAEFDAEEQRIRQLLIANEADANTPMTLTDIERALSHQILAQLLDDNRQWCSNFFDWPVYQEIFDSKGHSTDGGNAVMLGANESLSSLTFSAMAKEIYGVDKAYVIDIAAGDDKQKHGNFIFGDALNMPFRDSSMSIVHSNQLLHKLIEPQGERSTTRELMQRVLAEAYRVLRPGGQICMREILSNAQEPLEAGNLQASIQYHEVLKRSAVDLFQAEGFCNVSFAPLIVPSSLKGLVDPDRKFWQYGLEPRRHAYMMYARVGEK